MIFILQKIEHLDVQFITVIHKNLDKVDEDFVNTNLLPPYVSSLEHSYKVAFFLFVSFFFFKYYFITRYVI